jgi:hypothetical protein
MVPVPLAVDVLSPLRLTVAGAVVDVPGPKRRAVLALAHGRAVTVDRLLDALWPDDPPDSGRAALQGHVSRLRGHLGPPRRGYRRSAAPTGSCSPTTSSTPHAHGRSWPGPTGRPTRSTCSARRARSGGDHRTGSRQATELRSNARSASGPSTIRVIASAGTSSPTTVLRLMNSCGAGTSTRPGTKANACPTVKNQSRNAVSGRRRTKATAGPTVAGARVDMTVISDPENAASVALQKLGVRGVGGHPATTTPRGTNPPGRGGASTLSRAGSDLAEIPATSQGQLPMRSGSEVCEVPGGGR